MKIHEYQAAELFRQYGVETPEGRVAISADEAEKAAEALGGDTFILKAQVHTGGRGKAGGIRRARTPLEAGALAEKMLGSCLVTNQTGPEGKLIRCLYVTRGVDIQNEYYLSFAVDGGSSRIVMLASGEGGTEIEQIAKEHPEKIIREDIDISIGLRPYQARHISALIGIRPGLADDFVRAAMGFYRLFVEKDCSLVEVNPLAETADGRLTAIDAKINFDPNALFRHKDIISLRDINEEDPREAEASGFGLSYISLEGDIGCMVNKEIYTCSR
jgi:succinyl-CoA synthetase beta subunit